MKKIIGKIKENPIKSSFYISGVILILIFFLSIIITHGDTIKHYLFTDQHDTFMDFFNSMHDTIGRRPYEKGTIYPPLCYVIYYILLRTIPLEQLNLDAHAFKTLQAPILAFSFYMVISIAIFIICIIKMKKGSKNEKILFISIILMSLPFIFAFERANIIFIALILLMIFLIFKDSKNKILKEISLISLAASASIKIYPAVFGLILVKEKRWKEIIRVIIYGLVLFIVPFIFFGGFESILRFYNNITGATSDFNDNFIINKLNFSSTLGLIIQMFSITNGHIEVLTKIFIALLFLTSCINILTYNSKWKTMALLTCLLVGIPGISFTYTAIFFVIPIIYFLDDKKQKKPLDYIYLLLLILIMFANPIALFEGGSFSYFYNNISLNSKIMSISVLLLTIILNIENIIIIINKNKKNKLISEVKKEDKQKNKRITYIDVSKGIALFFVILGHLVKFDSDIFNWIFSFHMPLFFLLSGMCCNFEKYKSAFEFIKRKIKTLLIPYILFSIFGFIICLLIPAWRENLFTTDTLKQILYYAQPELLHVGQIWFLIALLFTNILFYVIENKILKRANKYIKVIFFIVLAIIGYKIYDIVNIPYFGRLPWKIDVAITSTVFMAIGYYFKKLNIIEKISNSKNFYLIFIWMIFINVVFGTIFNGYVNICNCTYGNILYYYISAISGSIIICLIGYKLRNIKILKYYGKNSLSMFSVHSMFLALTEVILYLIYNEHYYIMQNIPIHLCIICAFVIYICLYPVPKVYNFIQKKLKF